MQANCTVSPLYAAGNARARCPACTEAGHDQKGEHLVINADGSFGCVLYPGDAADAKEHRKRIFALGGDREIKSLSVHKIRHGTAGTCKSNPKTTAIPSRAIKIHLLGRLGRVYACSSAEIQNEQKEDVETKKYSSSTLEPVPRVPKTSATAPPPRQLPFVKVYSRISDEEIYFCENDHTRAALLQAGADESAIYTKDELRVLVAHNRARPFIPHELRKFHEIKRTFNGRIAK